MFHVGFMLCIVANWLLFLAGADPPTALEFSCDDSDGTISIKSNELDNYHSIFAIGTKAAAGDNQSNNLCDVTNESSGPDYKFQIRNCKPDFPVTVYIMKVPSQNQNNGVPQASGAKTLPPSGFIIGGDGVAAYTLECYKTSKAVNLPDIFQITKNYLLTLSPTISTYAPEGRVYIDMLILKYDGKSLESGPILLGTELMVLIKGPAGPVYHVKECRAFDSTDMGNTSTVLVSDTNAHHPELMKHFKVSTNSTTNLKTLCNTIFCMQATLYAFRFKNGNSITLECTIAVCNNNANCSGINTFNGTALTFQRRRRDSDSQSHVLRSTIVVQDHLLVNNPETTNNGNMHRTPFHLIATLAALMVFQILT